MRVNSSLGCSTSTRSFGGSVHPGRFHHQNWEKSGRSEVIKRAAVGVGSSSASMRNSSGPLVDGKALLGVLVNVHRELGGRDERPEALEAYLLSLDMSAYHEFFKKAALTKDRRQLSQAVQLFRWLQAKDYPLDNKSCTRAMALMNKLREPESALELFWWAVEKSQLESEEVELQSTSLQLPPEQAAAQQKAVSENPLRPTAHTFTTALKAAAISGDIIQGDRIWDLLHRRLYPVDLALLTVYMQIAAAKGDWEGIKRALKNGKEMATSGKESPERLAPMFATAISSALRLGRSTEALDLYRQMKGLGLGPNNHTASAVMAACAKIGTDEALDFANSVFSEMTDSGMKPDVASCTSFIRCLGQRGNVRRAERVLDWMWTSRLYPNVATYTAFLTVLAHDARKNGRRVLRVLDEMVARGLTPNAYTYSTAIRALVHSPADAAEVYGRWRASLSSGLAGSQDQHPGGGSSNQRRSHPSSSNKGGSSSASARPRGPQQHADISRASPAAAAAAQKLERERDQPASLEDLWSSGHVTPQMVPGAMMSVYLEHRMLDECLRILEDATSLGVSPNTFMYNAVLDALGKSGKLEEAEALFSRLEAQAAPSLSQSTLEYMASVYSYSGRPEKVEGLLQRMQRAGMDPSDFVYTMLVQAYDLAGDWRLALRVQRRLELAGRRPTIFTYNALLSACERHGQYNRALELVEDMEAKGVQINQTTRSLLAAIGSKGVEEINRQQSLATAVGAIGVAGAALIRLGIL